MQKYFNQVYWWNGALCYIQNAYSLIYIHVSKLHPNMMQYLIHKMLICRFSYSVITWSNAEKDEHNFSIVLNEISQRTVNKWLYMWNYDQILLDLFKLQWNVNVNFTRKANYSHWISLILDSGEVIFDAIALDEYRLRVLQSCKVVTFQ